MGNLISLPGIIPGAAPAAQIIDYHHPADGGIDWSSIRAHDAPRHYTPIGDSLVRIIVALPPDRVEAEDLMIFTILGTTTQENANTMCVDFQTTSGFQLVQDEMGYLYIEYDALFRMPILFYQVSGQIVMRVYSGNSEGDQQMAVQCALGDVLANVVL